MSDNKQTAVEWLRATVARSRYGSKVTEKNRQHARDLLELVEACNKLGSEVCDQTKSATDGEKAVFAALAKVEGRQ